MGISTVAWPGRDIDNSAGHQSARRTAAMASLKVGNGLAYPVADFGLLRACAGGQVDLDVHITAGAQLDTFDHPELGDGAAELGIDHFGQCGANVCSRIGHQG